MVNLGNIFDRHVKHEFVDHDVDSTMKTMVKEPIVHHVPTMTGGIGFDQVYNFYKTKFIGKMPNDTKLKRISRTIGKDQIVDELILCFTHDTEIPYMLAGIAPTGKYVEIPHVVVMKFKGNRIIHEHIYWDQASGTRTNRSFRQYKFTSYRYRTIQKTSRYFLSKEKNISQRTIVCVRNEVHVK